jgi:hypothetical protein
MNKLMIALGALLVVSAPAFAQNDNAKSMADALQANRGFASIAKTVSGNGNGGWGNIGSTLTGGQVSSRPAK